MMESVIKFLVLFSYFTSTLASSLKFAHDPIILNRNAINLASAPETNNVPQRLLASNVTSTTAEELFADIDYSTANYIIYSGNDNNALFSTAVSISDKWIAVGSNGYGVYTGQVLIYKPVSSTEFALDTTINTPTDPNANFGIHLSLDGSNLLIGANAYNAYTGRAFFYGYANGVWTLKKTISCPAAIVSKGFGYSTALSGSIAVVGTIGDYAVIYQKVGTKYIGSLLTAPIKGTFFGRRVAVSGNYVVVGAPGVSGSSGAVYVYKQVSVGKWTLKQTLASVTGDSSNFGYSVAISNLTIAVGAQGFREGVYKAAGQDSVNNTGWVYLYDLNPSTNNWVLTESLQSPVGRKSYFGASLSLVGDTLMVGADGYPSGNASGSAFLYSRVPYSPLGYSQWTLNMSFPSPSGVSSHFGYSVATTTKYAVVGAYGYNDLQGAVHLVKYPEVIAPTPTPTLAPTNGGQQLNNGSVVRSKTSLPTGIIIGLILLAILLVVLTATLLYCCKCGVVAAAVDKKKKKEEEDSPYTVHSYVGYSEMDDNGVPRPPSMMNSMYPSMYPYPPVNDLEKEKDLKKVDKADEGFIRRMFPYKVYGYTGGAQGEADFDYNVFQNAKEDNVSVASHKTKSSSSSGSAGVEYVSGYAPKTEKEITEGTDITNYRDNLRRHTNHVSDYIQSMYIGNKKEIDASDNGYIRDQQSVHSHATSSSSGSRRSSNRSSSSTYVSDAKARYEQVLAVVQKNPSLASKLSIKSPSSHSHSQSIESMTSDSSSIGPNTSLHSISEDLDLNDIPPQQVLSPKSVEIEALRAKTLAAQEELKVTREKNRLREEQRIRAEEKSRAHAAMARASSDEFNVKQGSPSSSPEKLQYVQSNIDDGDESPQP